MSSSENLNMTNQTAVERYRALIESHVANGIPRGEACRIAARTNMELRDQMIAEANDGRGGSLRTESQPTAGQAFAQFQELVNAKIAGGASRREAVRAVVLANPQLRERVVAEANPNRRTA